MYLEISFLIQKSMSFALFLTTSLLITSANGNVVFPSGFKVKNAVTDYHADPADNGNDDTDSLQKAINRSVGFHNFQYLYLPNGTYNVRKTLVWRRDTTYSNQTHDVSWQSGLHLIGQNRDSVIIKLMDNNSTNGFNNPDAPKAIIYTASEGSMVDGNSGFRNHISNLTIHIGSGNRGAVGIDYIGNNISSIRDVTIKTSDSGYAGISMRRGYPGPCLLKNVTVEGFRYGITVKHFETGITLESILLKNQTVAGILDSGNCLFIRNLQTRNAPVAIQNHNYSGYHGFIALDGGGFFDGPFNKNAIENEGRLFLRNIVASGYSSAIKNNGVADSGKIFSEYTSGGGGFSDDKGRKWVKTLFPTFPRSLNLPAEETPEYFDNDTANNWWNVQASGAMPDTMLDCSSQINNALSSGYSTIYFPPGAYYIKDSLLVTGAVKHIIGNGATIAPWGPKFDAAQSPKPVFYLASGLQNNLRIEHLDIFKLDTAAIRGWHPGAIAIKHVSSKNLTLSRVRIMPVEGADSSKIKASYQSTSGAGKLFLEDVASYGGLTGWHFSSGQKIWARQFNVEGSERNGTNIINDGADLWILGLKAENGQTVIETKNGGRTELLGGFLFNNANDSIPTGRPAFINTESSISLNYLNQVRSNAALDYYDTHVQETRNASTRYLMRSDLPLTGYSVWNILYAGYKKEAATPKGCDVGRDSLMVSAIKCLLE